MRSAVVALLAMQMQKTLPLPTDPAVITTTTTTTADGGGNALPRPQTRMTRLL